MDNIVNLRLKEMYTWIKQKKYEILMEAKKRFKFYSTTHESRNVALLLI